METKPILFRCSSLGKLMTEPRSKKDKDAGEFSLTASAYLDEFIALYKYGRSKSFSSKYTTKGTAVEGDGIELYKQVYNAHYVTKNEDWFNDGTIGGTPDIILKDRVIDIKSSWDISTFLSNKSVPKDYFYQLLGYCRLLNLKKGELVFCLSNTPESLIQREFVADYYRNSMIDLSDNDKATIAKNMVFTNDWYYRDELGNLITRDDYWDYLKLNHFPNTDIEFIEIPRDKRIKKFEIDFNDEDFEKLDNAITRAVQYVEDNYNII